MPSADRRAAQKATSKARLLSMSDLDHRTKAAQYAQATKAAIMADLGGADRLSTLELIQVENVSMCSVILRDLHVRFLRGEDIPVAAVATIENTLNRTAAMLGTQRRPRDITQDVDTYLKMRAAT